MQSLGNLADIPDLPHGSPLATFKNVPVTLQGVLATLVEHQTSAGQPQGPPTGTSGLPVKYFLQMSFAVYSKMVLDRVFDEYPLAIRMFFVQKV